MINTETQEKADMSSTYFIDFSSNRWEEDLLKAIDSDDIEPVLVNTHPRVKEYLISKDKGFHMVDKDEAATFQVGEDWLEDINFAKCRGDVFMLIHDNDMKVTHECIRLIQEACDKLCMRPIV